MWNQAIKLWNAHHITSMICIPKNTYKIDEQLQEWLRANIKQSSKKTNRIGNQNMKQ